MRLIRLALVCAIAGMVAACGTSRVVSVSGGEANALKGPEFVVTGATDFDQHWIDDTTESGIAALGWKRPAPRPPEWDKPLSRDMAAAPGTEQAKPPAVKKKHWWNRLRHKDASSTAG